MEAAAMFVKDGAYREGVTKVVKSRPARGGPRFDANALGGDE